jgi:hypothetical protein
MRALQAGWDLICSRLVLDRAGSELPDATDKAPREPLPDRTVPPPTPTAGTNAFVNRLREARVRRAARRWAQAVGAATRMILNHTGLVLGQNRASLSRGPLPDWSPLARIAPHAENLVDAMRAAARRRRIRCTLDALVALPGLLEGHPSPDIARSPRSRPMAPTTRTASMLK